MARQVVARLGIFLLSLAAASFAIFVITQALPGDVAAVILGHGATPEQLNEALELQRKAQWRLDFIAAENSMGFHAPQEAAKVLGEALDYARQGEVFVARLGYGATKVATAAPAAAPAEAKKN